jgi:hypothetical protein
LAIEIFVFLYICVILEKLMDEQQRKMLEEVVALSRENNAMIQKLANAQRRAATWRAAYWLVIIGASLVAYLYLQPYLTSLMKIYSGGDINQILDNLPK